MVYYDQRYLKFCTKYSKLERISPCIFLFEIFSSNQTLQTYFFWFISFKHPFGYLLQNRSSYKFRKTYRKTPVPEFLFDKAIHHQACNFIKKRLQLGCFTVNFAKLFKSSLLQDSSGEYFSFQFNLLNS